MVIRMNPITKDRNHIDNCRKVEITVQNVDGIPCAPIGKKMIFSADGILETEPWQLPWPMPWMEHVCRTFAMEMITVTQLKQARLYNPEEPDQCIEVLAKSYIDLTLGQLANETCRLYPEREALASSNGIRRFSYGQLRESSTALAKGLIAVGVEKNDKVAVWAVNSPEFVMAQFGTAKSGGVMVPLNAHERGPVIETTLRQSETTTLIMQPGAKSTENIDLLYRVCPELSKAEPGKLKAEKLPNLKNVIVISDEAYPGTFKWSEWIGLGKTIEDDILLQRQEQLDIEDVVCIIYTSGTTGAPKGVMLSHKNVIENAVAMAERMQLSETDVMYVQTPMFHSFGYVASALTAVTHGCSMIMVDKFHPEAAMKLIEREKCTVVSGVPTMFIAFINELEQQHFDISAVRTGIIAGASCPPKLIQNIEEVLGIKNIIPAYGLTEASPCVTAVYGDDPPELKASSVGAPIPGVEVKIIDPETQEAVDIGGSGEIRVRGYNIMSGYYRKAEETAAIVDKDGWLHTGDMGYLMPNGYLCIQDRYKDIIIRSGENISPKEIEDLLNFHPDVAESSVVGVPHDLYGEEVVAFVRLKDKCVLTAEMLRQYCRDRLATHKTPKAFHFMEQFPLSSSGKSLKSELRRMAVKLESEIKEQ